MGPPVHYHAINPADLVVEERLPLCAALHALGYQHATTLVPPPSRNGVLIAARCPFREHGAVDMGLPEPYRMISVDFATFRLSGVYMPNLLATILV